MSDGASLNLCDLKLLVLLLFIGMPIVMNSDWSSSLSSTAISSGFSSAGSSSWPIKRNNETVRKMIDKWELISNHHVASHVPFGMTLNWDPDEFLMEGLAKLVTIVRWHHLVLFHLFDVVLTDFLNVSKFPLRFRLWNEFRLKIPLIRF